ERLGFQKPLWTGVRVDVRDIRYVVALLLHPKRERKFPQQKLARALRERRVETLAIAAIGPIETDRDARPRVPVVWRRAVVVERPEIRPAVVGGPGRIRALKQ